MRRHRKYPSENCGELKTKLLQWAQKFSKICWLDSNEHNSSYGSYEAILAVGEFSHIRGSTFESLQNYREKTKDWIFGYLSYDVKNDVEKLTSNNFDGLHFPELYFFQPKKIFFLKNGNIELKYLSEFENEMDSDINEIFRTQIPSQKCTISRLNIQQRISKSDYIQKVDKMLQHINLGNIYEANFCQEFYAENAEINPLETFQRLNKISTPPFAAFLKLNDLFALCASPERYLKRTGNRIISQPIKGTAKRSENVEEDHLLAETLKHDPKEISENVMIVDLVRNDLSRTAKKGSVQVIELCAVYTFKQVHQLVSTISSEVEKDTPSVEILKTTFPMGSMTGAPKISAMEIIENLEESKRGLYSGAIGYFTPQGDFDLNVVIRSILYNSARKYTSFSVGSAITSKSIPENEYEECLVKAKAMRSALLNCD